MIGSELIVNPVHLKSIWAIGINTYHEDNIHYLHIPSNKNIIINTHSGNVSINGIFPFIKVNNEEGETSISITRRGYKFIECESKNGTVNIDAKAHGNKTILLGEGNFVVILQ